MFTPGSRFRLGHSNSCSKTLGWPAHNGCDFSKHGSHAAWSSSFGFCHWQPPSSILPPFLPLSLNPPPTVTMTTKASLSVSYVQSVHLGGYQPPFSLTYMTAALFHCHLKTLSRSIIGPCSLTSPTSPVSLSNTKDNAWHKIVVLFSSVQQLGNRSRGSETVHENFVPGV